ncbi:speedy protein 1-B-like [Pelodytes ibericus]
MQEMMVSGCERDQGRTGYLLNSSSLSQWILLETAGTTTASAAEAGMVDGEADSADEDNAFGQAEATYERETQQEHSRQKRKHQEEETGTYSSAIKHREDNKSPDPKKKREDEAQHQDTSRGSVETEAFYKLLEDDIIRGFLAMDTCLRTSDKYLLAMVLAYFRRAEMQVKEYNRMNFFVALFLANYVEEDEDFYQQIYPWALGRTWHQLLPQFRHVRDLLWIRLDHQAMVTRDTCEQIMAENPCHWAWARNRKDHHGWAIRWYLRTKEECIIRGPGSSPLLCHLCNT